jgi:hypothetical protein
MAETNEFESIKEKSKKKKKNLFSKFDCHVFYTIPKKQK